MPFDESCRRVLQVAALTALVAWVRAAPFPAHLVVQSGHHRPSQGAEPGGHHTVTWQEYPVALHPNNNSGADFRPILPGTDHGLYNKGFFEGDILRKSAASSSSDTDAGAGRTDPERVQTKNAVTDPNLLWPYATVVYKVDDDVGCPESPQCAILMAAMEHYHLNTCIRFKQWTGEDNGVSIFFNSDSSGACWSPVGRVGDGEQRLSLGQRCWYKGIVIHELGHAIGFWHEMNRPDRDDWIYVYWQNIIPGFASAFRKHQQVATLGEHFDYRSIMMYDEYAFSKDGRSPTLQATTGEEIGPIWRKRGLSASDRRRIEKLYKCDPKKPKRGFPYDVNCDFNRHVCGFKNGGSANWNWRTVNQTDGYVYTSFDTAGTTPGHFLSINFPPISGALESVRGELGCVRFYYLIETDGEAQLILDQAYLKTMTQLTHDEDTTFELWSNDTSSNEWIHMEIPLYVTRPFKLIFTSAFNGSATHGTIALDDVELLYTPCNRPASDASSSLSSGGQSTPKPTKPKPTKPSVDEATTTSTTAAPPFTTPDGMETEETPPSMQPTLGSETETSETETEDMLSTLGPATVSVLSLLTTAEAEEAIQQQQLQQQQSILTAQHLLELQQQKEQQQQLAQLAHDLQQHVAAHGHHGHRQDPEPADAEPVTTPASPQSESSPTDHTASIPPQKIPNLPTPTDRIPLKNPNASTTSTTTANPNYSDYDVDESLAGR